MNRYWVFAFNTGPYKDGGFNDFVGSYTSIPEAIEAGEQTRKDIFHVIDSTTGARVAYTQGVGSTRQVCIQ
jgi:hypothetical protein